MTSATPPVPNPGRGLLSHSLGVVVFFAASAAPTPLYRLYQHAWQVSPATLTSIFAIYAVALLVALLVGARLSDHVGRRPVIAGGIGLNVLAMLLFLFAQNPAWLFLARALQGLATGLATTALGAALLDQHRQRGADINSVTPMLGLALGALASTALAMLAPAPLRTVYGVLIGALLLSLISLWRTPETTPRRAGAIASLKPRLHVPATARAALLAVTPVNIAVWMLGGFNLSLMPSLVAQSTHVTSLWLGGSVVALMMLSGAVAVLAALRSQALTSLMAGAVLLLLGMALVLSAANLGSPAGLIGGAALSGAGFGSAFLGSLRSVLPLAEPHERSAVMGVFYIESYLAFSLPAIGLGLLAQQHGLLLAVNIYSAVIMLLVAIAIGWIALHRRHVVVVATH